MMLNVTVALAVSFSLSALMPSEVEGLSVLLLLTIKSHETGITALAATLPVPVPVMATFRVPPVLGKRVVVLEKSIQLALGSPPAAAV